MSEDRRSGEDRRSVPRDTPERRDKSGRALRSTEAPKIPCPDCGDWRSRVIPYRPQRPVEGYFSRNRVCPNGHRYETLEGVSHLARNHRNKLRVSNQ